MVSIEEAQRIILGYATPLPPEKVPLLHVLGRVAIEDVYAPWDIPPADNSAMDGYAFSHADLRGDHLIVAGFLPAGTERIEPVPAGETIRIMTGAPIPPGCDTVVPLEETEETGNGIRLKGIIKAGSHVRKKGEDIRAGDKAIAAGTLLRPQEVGMLASFGKTSATVFRTPRVGVLATGDELLEPGTPPSPGRIVNSNSYSIAAQVLEAGGEPVMLGIARDNQDSTREKIMAGLQADVLITTGGVSVGDKDYVKETIVELGGTIKFWKVNMKPGKPVAFAVMNGKPVFALPGNPVAAMVAFEMFVRPALLLMMGQHKIFRPTVGAVFTESFKNKGDRPHLVRVLVEKRGGEYVAATTGNQSSARISSLTAGNGLMKVAPGMALNPGDAVDIFLLDREFEHGEAPL